MLFSGDVYYESKGQLKKYTKGAKIFLIIWGILTLFYVIEGIRNEGKYSPVLDARGATKSSAYPQLAPSVQYKSVVVSETGIGDAFTFSRRELGGEAINYQSRAGVMNVMEAVVDDLDATGYVSVEKAYVFGEKYLVVVSTGEGGNSCPATTYAFTFDTKSEYLSGKVEIDGCSEEVEALAEGNKLTIKKEGKPSIFYNGDAK